MKARFKKNKDVVSHSYHHSLNIDNLINHYNVLKK